GGAGEPGRTRQEDAEACCRSHGRRDRQAREEARRDGALDRRIVRPDARRAWALGSHGCHRPGRVSRRPAAAPVHAQGEWTFPVEPPVSRPRHHAHLRPVQIRLDERPRRSEEHTSELQSRPHLVCRLLLEKKKKLKNTTYYVKKKKKKKNIHNKNKKK